MAKYIITEKAGRFVAGHRNPGVGTVLELTDSQAAYELTLGTLVAVQAEEAVVEQPDLEVPEEAPEQVIPVAKKTRKKR